MVAVGTAFVFMVLRALMAFVLTGNQSGNLVTVAAAALGAKDVAVAEAFAAYPAMKGLKYLIDISLGNALLIGLAVGLAMTLPMRPVIRRQSQGMEHRKKSFGRLFGVPLILSAALLSFSHGANGVANAVGSVFDREWKAERKLRAPNLQKGRPLLPDERSLRKLVRRAHLLSTGAASVITVPMTATPSARMVLVLRAIG